MPGEAIAHRVAINRGQTALMRMFIAIKGRRRGEPDDAVFAAVYAAALDADDSAPEEC